MDDATLTIGEVALQAGLRTSAIRYYERVGVLPEPMRVSGQRRYTADTLGRLRAVDAAKRAGFTLEETRTLLNAALVHEPLRALAERKLPEVDALIAQAQAMRRWLEAARECDCETVDVCALFEAPA